MPIQKACCSLIILFGALAAAGPLRGEAVAFDAAGYISLFNGKDLTGWEFRPSSEADKKAKANWHRSDPNAPPWPILTESTDFSGQLQSTNGRYVARDGSLVVTVPSEGRKIQQIWTTRDFPNDFVVQLDFRASPNADSGIFIRGRQLQCRDYLTAGPYKELQKYRPQEWNKVTIVVRGRNAHCTCNGEVLEANWKVPQTGPIGLEGDRGQLEYRNIRLKEISPVLPRSTPGRHAVSAESIERFVDALDKIDSVHSFMILRHGHVISEGWWTPFQASAPHKLYSLSKSFTSTAVGMAIDEGKLSLDDSVVSFFPGELPAEPSAHLKAMRVRDLLTMSTGHARDDLRQFSFTDDGSLTRKFLSLPVRHQPGTHFLYNTPATYMCSAIVQEVTGQKTVDYLQSRLFEPLGIDRPFWSESAQGISHGGYGLNLRTEDIAKFGQLLLQRGQWQGQQLVSAAWIEMATARQVSNGSDPNSDWQQGYGYQFWRCRHGHFRGDGAFGQFCIVMPQHSMVLAVTSGTNNMGAVMQAAWDHLQPGIGIDQIENSDADKQLKARLERLGRPTLVSAIDAKKASEKWKAVGQRGFRFPENEAGLEHLQIQLTENVRLSYTDEAGQHELVAGFGQWKQQIAKSAGCLSERLSLPEPSRVAVAGDAGWVDESTLKVRYWFVESPYRVELLIKLHDDKVNVSARYNVAFGDRNIFSDLVGIASKPTEESVGARPDEALCR